MYISTLYATRAGVYVFFRALTKGIISTDPTKEQGLISYRDGQRSLAVRFDISTFSDFTVDGFYVEWTPTDYDGRAFIDRYVMFDEREVLDNTVRRWADAASAARAFLAARSQNFVVIHKTSAVQLWAGTVTHDGELYYQNGKRPRRIPEDYVLKRRVRDDVFPTADDHSIIHFGGLIDVDEPETTWRRILHAKTVNTNAMSI